MGEADTLVLQGSVSHYDKFFIELQDFLYQPQNLSSTLLQIFGAVLKCKSDEKDSERNLRLELFKKVDNVFDGFLHRKFFFKGKETSIKTNLIVNFGFIFLEEDSYEAKAQKCMEVLMKMKLKLTEMETSPPNPYVPGTIGHLCEKYLSYFRHKMEFTDQFRIIDKVLQAHNNKKSLSYGVCLYVKSTIYIAAKDFTNGKKLLKEALRMCQSTIYERSQITARLGDCYRLSGSYEKALLHYRGVTATHGSIEIHTLQEQLRVKCFLRQSECHWLMNEHSKAREVLGALNQALTESVKAKLKEDKARGIDAEDDWNQCYKRISDTITSREAHPDQDIEAKIQLSYKLVDDIYALSTQKKYWDVLELLKKVYALKMEIYNGELSKSDLKVLLPRKLESLDYLVNNYKEDHLVLTELYLDRACTYLEKVQLLSDDIDTNARICNYNAGGCFCSADYWPEAVKYTKKAIKKEEGDKMTYDFTPYDCFNILGLCYYEQGRLKKALQYLRASAWGIKEKHEKFPYLQWLLARSHFLAKHYDEVKNIYELMLKSNWTEKYCDEAWQIKILHSRSLIALKQYQDAINLLSKINRPNDAYLHVIVHILLCQCYHNSDDPYDEDFLWEEMENIYNQYNFNEIYSVLEEFHFLKTDLHSFLELSKEYLEDEEDELVPDYMLFVNSNYITGMFRLKRLAYDDHDDS